MLSQFCTTQCYDIMYLFSNFIASFLIIIYIMSKQDCYEGLGMELLLDNKLYGYHTNYVVVVLNQSGTSL